MRILTVRQLWAWAIIHGGKDVENRVRNIAGGYRGPVAIHAGLSYDSAWRSRTLDDAMRASGARREPGDPPWWRNLGHIIGVVDLVDEHLDTDHEHDAGMPSACRCRSAWAETGAHHLVLANPRALDEPIPHKGALGLRKTDFGIEGDWLIEHHEPCKYPCAGVEYGCPPSCHMDPLARLVATS